MMPSGCAPMRSWPQALHVFPCRACDSARPALEAAGILDQETANLRAYKLKNEIAQIQGRLDQLPPDNLTIIARAVAFPQFWRDLSEIERRFYFREFIRRIEIERETAKNWHLRLIFVF